MKGVVVLAASLVALLVDGFSPVASHHQRLSFRCAAPVDDDMKLAAIKAQEAFLQSQLKEIQRQKARVLATRRLRIGVVGFGRFGQFLAARFRRAPHDVSVLSRSDRAAEAADAGAISYFALGADSDVAEFMAQDLDVVVLAVSIVSFRETLERLAPFVAARCNATHAPLLVDVLSVKEHARRAMLELLPSEASILCTHPMFGPDSGRHGWNDLPFVFDRVRIRDDAIDRCERFLCIFESEGCRMVELGCRQHDVYAANSQFLTHLVGRMLGETGLSLRKTPVDTRGFESVLRIVETTCDDSFDLFYGLYRYNQHSKSTLLSLRKALADLELRLIHLELTDTTTSQSMIPPPPADLPRNPPPHQSLSEVRLINAESSSAASPADLHSSS
ncbi:hypothetical protein CTAYLR_006846 [Chrysophaeum taylorii]|uniref:Prephenate/arogenate dehydrogenase domain-containing protein n=1 Tax=Chrysophaeum taylorii TaxID=2483200 RepID=A0AAD7U7E0_9STRA|nr:hypothetical protein CTAYLR_006846 [Chrysophaeum taylorii]